MGFQGEKRTVLLRLMILMMISDKEIHTREKKIIQEIHEKLTGEDLGYAEIERELAVVGGENKQLMEFLREISAGFTLTERELTMKAVFLVGLADGIFRNAEEKMLMDTAAILEIPGERLHEIVEEVLTTEKD